MKLLITALFLGFLFTALAILFQLYRRTERKRALNGLELTPNCLLTRYPIIFLSGRRSPFRPFDHWNAIPAYLREHGYDVREIDTFKDASAEAIIPSIDSLSAEQCHLIADSSSLSVLEAIARFKHPKIASLTCVRNKELSQQTSAPAVLTCHELKPLDHAIEYFELDEPTSRKGWREIAAVLCLRIHNLFFVERERQVDPLETAEFENSFSITSKFLGLAVSLAERDLMQGNTAIGKE